MVLRNLRKREVVSFQTICILLCLPDVRIEVVLELDLLLIHLQLVAVKVTELIGHAVSQLVFFDIKAALVDFLFTLGTELNLRRGPIRQDIICFIKQIVQTVEVALNSNFHLITLRYLFTG